MFFWLVWAIIVLPVGIGGATLVMWLVSKITGSKESIWVAALALPVLLVVLFAVPLWRQLSCALLFKFVVHEPLQEIHQTVTSPESVYWQDDVRPGFDASGRKWMIEKYLDGVHLKALALNGDDGKISIYHADEKNHLETQRLRQAWNQKAKELVAKRGELELALRSRTGTAATHKALEERLKEIEKEFKTSPECAAYDKQQKKEYQGILNQAEVFDSASRLPPMRYQIHSYPLDRLWRVLGFYRADQIDITEAATGKLIAHSRRYMRAANLGEKLLIGWEYTSNDSPGDSNLFSFPDKVLFTYVQHAR